MIQMLDQKERRKRGKHSRPSQWYSLAGPLAVIHLAACLFLMGQVSCGSEEDKDFGTCTWACDKHFGTNDDLVRSKCVDRACDDSDTCEYRWKPPEWEEDDYPDTEDGYIDIVCDKAR